MTSVGRFDIARVVSCMERCFFELQTNGNLPLSVLEQG